jgi:hypothetical protein
MHRSDTGDPAFRHRVPRAGGARQEALPHARRRTRVRRAKGKPERVEARAVQQGCDRRAEADAGVVERRPEAVGRDEVIPFCPFSHAKAPGRKTTR